MMQRHLVAMFLLCAPLCACEEAPAPEGPVAGGPDAGVDMVDPCAAGCALGFVNLPSEVSAALGREESFQAETRGGVGTVTFTVSERCALTGEVVGRGLVRWICPAEPEVCAIQVELRDEAGAVVEAPLRVRCEDQAPRFEVPAPKTALEHERYEHEIRCVDPEGEQTQVRLSSEDTCGGSLVGERYVWTPTEAEGGTSCVVGLWCDSGARFVSEATVVVVLEGDQPPSMAGLPVEITAAEGERVRHETGALDPEHGRVRVTVAESSCSFDVAVEGTAVSYVCGGPERCELTLRGSDGVNAVEGALQARCVDTAPRLAEPPPALAFEHQRYEWRPRCVDAEGDPTTLVLSNQTCGGRWSEGLLSFTPSEQRGGSRCGFVVRCADDRLMATEQFEVEILEVNAPPVFHNLPATLTGARNQRHTFVLSYGDEDVPMQRLTESLASTTCARQPTLLGGQVTYQCGATAETCEVAVRVSDGEVSAEETLTIQCRNMPPTATGVEINPTQLPEYSVPLFCSHQLRDEDEDGVVAVVEWLLDGVVIATGETLPASPRGGELRCRVTPRDVFGTGAPVSSAPLVVQPRQGIAAGAAHTCAIKGGALYCWGANDRGQLGDGTTTGGEAPRPPLLAAPVSGVAAGLRHTCAVSAGALYCWGANEAGQLGDGTRLDRAAPVAVAGMDAEVTHVSAGAAHTCAVRAGALYCWGANERGQLGDGTTLGIEVAVGVTGMGAGVTHVSAGGAHTCAMRGDALYCWGANEAGQLGDGTTVDRGVAGAAVLSQTILIKAGGAHTCALNAVGPHCWGANEAGQLGDGTRTSRTTPTYVQGVGSQPEALTLGERHTCAVGSGMLYCWGANAQGQVGLAPGGQRVAPTPRGSGNQMGRLALGSAHTCLQKVSADELWCWGDNAARQLGVPGLEPQLAPREVFNRSNVDSIALGARHTCADVGRSGELCWGDNQHGQLGDGTTLDRPIPKPPSATGWPVSRVAAGAEHSCGGEVTLTCWGRNQHGQLGQGDQTTRLVPQYISPATGESAGAGHTCARMSGEVWCWGDNSSGQVGDGTSVTRLTPVRLSLQAVTQVSAGEAHTCALAGGALYCWGANDRGQLGDGATQDRLTPQVVPGMIAGVTHVSAGGSHTCAIQNQQLRCWGGNDRGQLGDGTTQDRLTPTMIAMTHPAAQVSAGGAHTCALAGGALYCWGANDRGQVGDGTTQDRVSPTSVAASIVATLVGAGEGHTCAVSGGRVWCWGDNGHGQLGIGAELWWERLPVALP